MDTIVERFYLSSKLIFKSSELKQGDQKYQSARKKLTETKLWQKILNDYEVLGLENTYPQSLYRPGHIIDFVPFKSIKLQSYDNKIYIVKIEPSTSFYLPEDYIKDGEEVLSYTPNQISQDTAFKYYIKTGKTILVEAFSDVAFKDNEKYKGNYSILIAD
ncbi:MAG: hypothetical protein U0525_05745 [Patescibacteria group bacterium]